MKNATHPTITAYKKRKKNNSAYEEKLNADKLKNIAREAGAVDVGLIDIAREKLRDHVDSLKYAMPSVRSIMVLAFKVNKPHLQSSARSVVDHEFGMVWKKANSSARNIVEKLGQLNIKALNMPAGFPFEISRLPDKIWLTCDKLFAVEAGIGQMGYNRLVLHPVHGSAIILESILLAEDCDEYDYPIDFNPCIQCGLCLKACPVGAVKSTDDFDMMACLTHNYREKLGGFQDWVEQIIESKNTNDYRKRVSDKETLSMWQHLAIGAQNRCDRCMGVCPAGDISIGEYVDERKGFINRTLKAFRTTTDPIYVVKGSDAEKHANKNFSQRPIKTVSNGLRAQSAEHFINALDMLFQPGNSEGIDAVYHFTFTGNEQLERTVIIRDQQLTVTSGHKGSHDLHIIADSQTWIQFLTKEKRLLPAIITKKIKFKGNIKLLKSFEKCFPS